MQTQPLSVRSHPQPRLETATAPPGRIEDQVSIGQEEARSSSLSPWMRGVSLVLIGAIGAVSLTGCSRPPAPPPVDGTTHQDAREQLSQRLTEIEKEIQQSQSQPGQQSPDAATRKFMDAVKDYAKKTGRSADQVAQDLRGFMIEHPALTLTVAYGLGVAAGIGLERLGLSEQLEKGVDGIVQAVKEHPIIAIAVAAAAVGAILYFTYDAVQAETQAIPPAPQTPEAQKLRESFDQLEQQASQPGADARQIDRSLKEQIAEYARATGRTAEQVKQDLQQFYVEHPGVSAAVVLAAGVGTGVVLERAGVPGHIARAAQIALASSENGLAGAAEAIREHPVLATAIGVGIAAGAGYLIYQHMQ